jgi:hypothetical protein
MKAIDLYVYLCYRTRSIKIEIKYSSSSRDIECRVQLYAHINQQLKALIGTSTTSYS